jgi:preprotein translocase subunit SecF
VGPEIFVHTNYNFVGKRHFFVAASLVILALSATSIFTKGFNYGVEFTGGAQLEVNFNEAGTLPKTPPSLDNVRQALEAVGIHGANVVTVGAPAEHDFLIRVQSNTAEGGENVGDEIRSAIVKKFGEDKVTKFNFDKETRDSAHAYIDDPNVTADDIKAALASEAIKGVRVDEVRKDKATGEFTIVLANSARDVLAALDTTFGRASFDESVDAIGAAVSKDLRRNAFLSIAGACILIAIYVWLRFDIDFAPGVVVALIHDAGITCGIWSLLGLEFNLTFVAAVLAIIGYSVTDTVVVYDRIRENMEKHQSNDMFWIINKAVNDTLSRTILTSFATFLSTIAIALLGSESISGFGWAMSIGIIVGTYSSIYIAAPVTVFVHELRERQRLSEAKQAARQGS